jgi:acetoin utilization protein AcuB
MMRVGDLMSRVVVSVPGSTPVLDARAVMLKEHIRHLLVVDEGRLQGIVTDRDVRLNLPSPATSLSVWEINHLLARLTVAEVMTKDVIVVDAQRDAREAARILVDHKIGALPVLEGERLLGVITETDVLQAFAAGSAPVAAAR